MPTFLSVAALVVVIITTANTTRDDKVGVMTTLGFLLMTVP